MILTVRDARVARARRKVEQRDIVRRKRLVQRGEQAVQRGAAVHVCVERGECTGLRRRLVRLSIRWRVFCLCCGGVCVECTARVLGLRGTVVALAALAAAVSACPPPFPRRAPLTRPALRVAHLGVQPSIALGVT